MLFGIDYARSIMRKLQEQEKEAYCAGYQNAVEDRKKYQDGYAAGYSDGYAAGRTFAVSIHGGNGMPEDQHDDSR